MNRIFALIFLLVFTMAGVTHAADLDFDVDNDTKIDDAFLDFSWDITGAVECDGAGDCTQAEIEDLSNYNAIDPDYILGDADDDNKLDPEAIDLIELAVSMSVDDLITLSGISEGAQHLGTFTGAIIDDNLTIKAAFQDLETHIEGLGGGHDPVTLGTNLNSNLLGLSSQQLTLDSQAANMIFAGPASGGSAAPSFRSLVAADIPDISATYEVQLNNEAGLYAVLSDVSDFHQPGDTLRTDSATSLPGSCTVGDMYIDTDADTDGTLYICVATDTWKDVDDDGGAGSDVLAKVSSNETDADYLVNQISSTSGEINVTESGSGDETLMVDIDVDPSSGFDTLEISEDAIQVKYKAADFDETDADGLTIDYTNGQKATGSQDGFLAQADWTTFNNKEDDTHASEHAVGGADPVFPADPNFNGILTWDDTAGLSEWGQSADLTYDGSNWSVVDDSHSHVYSNIDPFTEANLYTILSDVTQFYESGDDADFKSVTFTDEDASPSATAGELKYDNTIAGLIDGGLVWYDDDEIQLIVSVPMDNFGTGPTDDYVVAYDAIGDEHYYVEMGGVGGNTKFNLIADADADGTIQLLGFEQEITTTIDESGGVALTFKHTDSDGLTNDTYLVEFIHANDGDAQAHFIRGLDNTSDELWKIAYDGTIHAKAFETTGQSATPGFIAKDADCPGSDKEIGKITWNYLSGTDGQEDGAVYIQVMQGNGGASIERTIFEYDADTEAITLGSSVMGEDLIVDFDTGVGNKVKVSSNSGVNEIDFSAINLVTTGNLTSGGADFSSGGITNVGNISDDAAFSLSSTGGTITIENIRFNANAIESPSSSIVINATESNQDITFNVDNAGVDWGVKIDGSEATFQIGDGDAQDHVIKIDASANDLTLTWDEDQGTLESSGDFLAPINISTKSAAYTIGTDNTEEAYGTLFINTAVATIEYSLPSAVAGMSVCVMNGQGVTQIIQLDANTGDYIVLDGARTSLASEHIASSGAAGDKVCVVAADATDWYVTSYTGSWAEE